MRSGSSSDTNFSTNSGAADHAEINRLFGRNAFSIVNGERLPDCGPAAHHLQACPDRTHRQDTRLGQERDPRQIRTGKARESRAEKGTTVQSLHAAASVDRLRPTALGIELVNPHVASSASPARRVVGSFARSASRTTSAKANPGRSIGLASGTPVWPLPAVSEAA